MESLTKAHRKKIINLGLDYLFLKKKKRRIFSNKPFELSVRRPDAIFPI